MIEGTKLERLQRIIDLYDRKVTNPEDINAILAVSDGLFFNHSGITSGNEVPTLPTDEGVLLKLLHQMEVAQVREVARHLAHLGPASVLLDTGCGGGGTSILIHELTQSRVLGIDTSLQQLARAREAIPRRGLQDMVDCVPGNFLDLKFASQTFDAILANENSEHVSDLTAMFQEFVRVLKREGVIVVVAWCATSSETGKQAKEQVDSHYLTDIHTRNQYLSAIASVGARLQYSVDLTSRIAPYWKLRSNSAYRTGSESFMGFGFSTRHLEYHLLRFTAEEWP